MGLANVSLLQEVLPPWCVNKNQVQGHDQGCEFCAECLSEDSFSLSRLFKGLLSPMTACTFSLKQNLCECLWTSENDNMPVSNHLNNDGVRQSAQGPQRISGMAGILIKTSEWLSVPMPCNKKNADTQGGPAHPWRPLLKSFSTFQVILGPPDFSSIRSIYATVRMASPGTSHGPSLYFSALCQETPFLFL